MKPIGAWSPNATIKGVKQRAQSRRWKGGLAPALCFCFPRSMARKWSNQNLPGALHFVTGNFLNRIPVFRRAQCCQSFVETCAQLITDWPCKLIAYVLMPDHFHFVVNPQDGRIIEFTGKLKSISARSIIASAPDLGVGSAADGSVHQVW